MKQCNSCKEYKTEDLFYSSKHTKDSLRRECKKCSSIINKRTRDKLRIKLSEIVGLKCGDCGREEESLSFFDFHHIDPSTKKASIASLLTGSSMTKLMEEVKKCILLCPNCHRRRHMLEVNKGSMN
jgi:hypothetical protein